MSPEPPHRFRAMDVDVIAGGAAVAHAAAIEALFAERERVFSRFRPHSELALVNATHRYSPTRATARSIGPRSAGG